mmetsp:Transcript_17774/g.53277  ORF Transcript_17774/g.53277 Transcript_17774/m.53277 type:complete len:421 (-) Transcript_17774:346-1608(-)
MVRSSTAAVVALGATGAAAALGLGLAVVLSLHARGGGGGGGTSRAGSGRSGGPSSSLGRALSRMVTRRPASFYEALPLVKLINPAGMQVHISAMGAVITKMIVPDKSGRKADVVLGYEDVESYSTAQPVTYFGAIVGRCANRIAGGKFTIDGETFNLLKNDGDNALHGGSMGLHKRVFEVRETSTDDYDGVELSYNSPDGEEGYPGNLYITVAYRLSRTSNQLSTEIRASTDAATPVNIVQHSYFNLAGHSAGDILGHTLRVVGGDHYTPVSASLAPTGEILPVAGTPFDFTSTHRIGERIAKTPGGYDHNFVLFGLGPQTRYAVRPNGSVSDSPRLAAELHDPSSGRTMQVLTTAPGMQFYSGNFLDGVAGKNRAVYQKHAGLCLETQAFPDSVNQPTFPNVVIKPGEPYRHEVVYRFT